MCEHHHAAKHILCSQCDMLVALPRLEHGQKAACPPVWHNVNRGVGCPSAASHRLCVGCTVHAVAVQLVSFCEYERCRSHQ